MKDHNSKLPLKKKVMTVLEKPECEFLEKLSRDCFFSTGYKISKNEVLCAFIDAAIALEISGSGIKNKHDLVHRIIDTIANQVEQRRYPRINTHLSVEFKRINSYEKYTYSTTYDISLGGFSMDVVCLENPPAVNQVMEINICDPAEKYNTQVSAIGRIVWVKEKEGEHAFRMGVMFVQITPENQKRFIKIMHKASL